MRVQNLRDAPAFCLGGLQTFGTVQRINRQRFTGLTARYQVIEVAVGIGGPDLLNDHAHVLLTLSKGSLMTTSIYCFII
jgi:hypothetical protein